MPLNYTHVNRWNELSSCLFVCFFQELQTLSKGKKEEKAVGMVWADPGTGRLFFLITSPWQLIWLSTWWDFESPWKQVWAYMWAEVSRLGWPWWKEPSKASHRQNTRSEQKKWAERQHSWLSASWLWARCDHLLPATASTVMGCTCGQNQTLPSLPAFVKGLVSTVSQGIQSLTSENKVEIDSMLTPSGHSASNSAWDDWIWIHHVGWNQWLPLIALTGAESVSLTFYFGLFQPLSSLP